MPHFIVPSRTRRSLLALSIAWWAGLRTAPAAGAVPSYPGNSDPFLLVDAAWLQSEGSDTRVLDASSLARYRDGHIPGAVHAWWQDTMDPNGAVYGTVLKPESNDPEPQRLRREWLEDIGVSPDRPVVAYDDEGGYRAARIVWTLRLLGHTRAGLLDGGLMAWQSAGGSIETRENDAPRPPSTSVVPQEGFYLVREQVMTRLADPRTLLVDVRTGGELALTFDDTVTPGTIDGAISLPWPELLDPSGAALLQSSGLQDRVAASGLSADRLVILFGNFGTDTSLHWLALKLLGFPEVLVYDGGWVEWSSPPPTPN